MNTAEIPDTPNPFTSAKIVGVGIDPEAYHRENVPRGHPDYLMGRSTLMSFADNPRKWLKGAVSEKTKSTEWGDLMDCLVTDRGRFAERFIVAPATYPAGKRHKKVTAGEIGEGDPLPWNAASTWCKAWVEDNVDDGMRMIKNADIVEADLALKALREDEQIAAVLDASQFQVMVVAQYEDRATGLVIPCKCLLDIVPDKDGPYGRSLMDFKTARCASPALWPKTVFEYEYHVQAAFYHHAYVKATGEDRIDFCHIISENEPPYETGREIVSDEFLRMGRLYYTDALRKYAQCLKTGVWPGYPPAQNVLNGWNVADLLHWMVK